MREPGLEGVLNVFACLTRGWLLVSPFLHDLAVLHQHLRLKPQLKMVGSGGGEEEKGESNRLTPLVAM